MTLIQKLNQLMFQKNVNKIANMFIEEIYNKINQKEYGSIRKIIESCFSGTEDNINCGDIINISQYVNPYTKQKVAGLTIGNTDLLNIAYVIENDEDFIKLTSKVFPNLTEKQIEAYFRFVTLIFASMEINIKK